MYLTLPVHRRSINPHVYVTQEQLAFYVTHYRHKEEGEEPIITICIQWCWFMAVFYSKIPISL
jgi:hypothetical protein